MVTVDAMHVHIREFPCVSQLLPLLMWCTSLYVRMYIHVCICWPSFIVGHKDAVCSLLLMFLEALLLYVVRQLFILLTYVLHTYVRECTHSLSSRRVRTCVCTYVRI